jgi:hypothetical protein
VLATLLKSPVDKTGWVIPGDGSLTLRDLVGGG